MEALIRTHSELYMVENNMGRYNIFTINKTLDLCNLYCIYTHLVIYALHKKNTQKKTKNKKQPGSVSVLHPSLKRHNHNVHC